MAVQISGGVIDGVGPDHDCQEELPGDFVYKYNIDDSIRRNVRKKSVSRCSCGALWIASQHGYNGNIRWDRATGWIKFKNRNKGWAVPA